jgi:TonB family protein
LHRLRWVLSCLLEMAGCAAIAAYSTQSEKKDAAEPAEQVYEIGPGVSAPRILKKVNPVYPGRGVRVEGTVTIGLVVSSRGMPSDPRVVKGLEKEVDQSAIDAVKQWRFAPAVKDSKPVAVKVLLEIEFHSM